MGANGLQVNEINNQATKHPKHTDNNNNNNCSNNKQQQQQQDNDFNSNTNQPDRYTILYIYIQIK